MTEYKENEKTNEVIPQGFVYELLARSKNHSMTITVDDCDETQEENNPYPWKYRKVSLTMDVLCFDGNDIEKLYDEANIGTHYVNVELSRYDELLEQEHILRTIRKHRENSLWNKILNFFGYGE